jgi:hypothetical protein
LRRGAGAVDDERPGRRQCLWCRSDADRLGKSRRISADGGHDVVTRRIGGWVRNKCEVRSIRPDLRRSAIDRYGGPAVPDRPEHEVRIAGCDRVVRRRKGDVRCQRAVDERHTWERRRGSISGSDRSGRAWRWDRSPRTTRTGASDHGNGECKGERRGFRRRRGHHASKVMDRAAFIDPPLDHSYIRAPWRFPPWNRLREGDFTARETDDCPYAYGGLMHRAEHRR